MTIEEFQQELESSSPGAMNIYRQFKTYQEKVLLALCAFRDVCENNRIPYQLAYGSLLGAVRDSGQIPWDYDIDVFVPYCEKDHLIEVLKKELDDSYYFICPEVNPVCRHFFMRVTPKGYRSEAIHVDVFYVIGAPDEEPLEFGKKVLRLVRLRFAKLVYVRMETKGKPKKSIRWYLRKLKYLPISIKTISDEFHELCSRYDCYHSKNLMSIDEWLDRQILPNKIWQTELIETTNGSFRIASCYDELLTTMYGDYHKIPPLSARIDEFTHAYQRLRYFEENW